MVENRFIGIKSRGVYETPGGTLLLNAHRAIESVTLDKETMHKKDSVMPRYAELIYNGYWYSKERFKLQKIIDLKRGKVNGSVKLKLYKGNITIQSRITKSNAYSMKKVSFEENKTFNKSNVERFINFHKKQLRWFYLVILSTNFFAKGPTNKAVPMAIGRLTVQAFKNLWMYSLSIPVLTKVIIKVIKRLIKNPIIKTNNNWECFFENINELFRVSFFKAFNRIT
mgnify:CR=1 FL=1